MRSEEDHEAAVPRSATQTRRSRKEFDDLWTEVLNLAALTRRTLTASVRALCEDNTDLTELIAEVKSVEADINRRDVGIERECLRLLALYEPVASDLRRVATALRVNGQLERIGDLAAHIAKRSKKP